MTEFWFLVSEDRELLLSDAMAAPGDGLAEDFEVDHGIGTARIGHAHRQEVRRIQNLNTGIVLAIGRCHRFCVS